jgi:hypothetical protein
MNWLQFDWQIIFAVLLFWANILMSWAITTVGCSGIVFTALDVYTRRDEIATATLLREANALLKKAEKETKKRGYVNV